MDFVFQDKAFTLRLVRVDNTFGSDRFAPSHSRRMLLSVQLLEEHSKAGIFGEVRVELKGIAKQNESHKSVALYDYFRSFFDCEEATLELFMNRLFMLLEKTYVVPVFMSLLLVVMWELAPKNISTMPLTSTTIST